jgi:hypothetical protein
MDLALTPTSIWEEAALPQIPELRAFQMFSLLRPLRENGPRGQHDLDRMNQHP